MGLQSIPPQKHQFPGCPNLVAQASVDPYLAPLGSTFIFDGSAYYDSYEATTVSYHWDFGDGHSYSGDSATQSHTYTASGIYNAVLTVTDAWGVQSTDTVMVVVYDPNAGFGTGGGWFIPGGKTSDFGDILPGVDSTSPANIGFVVKFKAGVIKPDGQLEFQHRQGDFNLHSNGMDWLVIANNRWAKFQGTATMKDRDGLSQFRVDARDGDFGEGDSQLDRFIIKVWHLCDDPEKDETIHKASGDLEGGSIVIHAKNK